MNQALKRLPRPAPWAWDVALLVLPCALPYLSFMDRSRTSLAVYAAST